MTRAHTRTYMCPPKSNGAAQGKGLREKARPYLSSNFRGISTSIPCSGGAAPARDRAIISLTRCRKWSAAAHNALWETRSAFLGQVHWMSQELGSSSSSAMNHKKKSIPWAFEMCTCLPILVQTLSDVYCLANIDSNHILSPQRPRPLTVQSWHPWRSCHSQLINPRSQIEVWKVLNLTPLYPDLSCRIIAPIWRTY